MKRIAIAVALLVSPLALQAASAADLGMKDGPSLPGFESTKVGTWDGFYIGAHGGWATGEWNGTLEYRGGEAGYKDDTRSLGGEGWLGGVQVGAQKQWGQIVLGVEGDISWTDFNGHGAYTTDAATSFDSGTGSGNYTKTHDFSIDDFGTARVRAGYAIGRFLPYVTGGLAWAQTHGDLEVSYPNAGNDAPNYGKVSTASADESHIGWTIGGGVEADLGRGWSVKAEYLHIDLGEEGYGFKGAVYNGAPFNTDSFPADLAFDVFRVGLNYRFGGARD